MRGQKKKRLETFLYRFCKGSVHRGLARPEEPGRKQAAYCDIYSGASASASLTSEHGTEGVALEVVFEIGEIPDSRVGDDRSSVDGWHRVPTIEGLMRTTREEVVTAGHGHTQLRSSHRYVASLLSRIRKSDGGRSGLLQREGGRWREVVGDVGEMGE
ncbi:hypothetical protein EVAR_42451_1 [Eumeta japonica]|uniref:Uncharacterized protein n=1 Tax=Eumeta variegata TaxID=151549 RepID=A0A4C1XZ45_EUMVA|nr:hypothetical protein EVAR_42451_1 [Eumeta japonica]